MLARNAARMASRCPGLAVMMAMTWIMGRAPWGRPMVPANIAYTRHARVRPSGERGAGIHAFPRERLPRRGWPDRSPAMTLGEKTRHEVRAYFSEASTLA